jgi:hypothetical protein
MSLTHNSSSNDLSNFRSNEIVRRRGALHALDLAGSRNPGDSCVVHENCHESATDVHPTTLGQLGVYAARSIGATTVGVNLSDEPG